MQSSGSSDSTRIVLSQPPRATKRERRRPGGTAPISRHEISWPLSFLSISASACCASSSK